MCVAIYIAIAADINYVQSLISPNRQSWSWWCLLFSPTLLAQRSHFTTIHTLEQTEVITYNQLLPSMNPYRRRCLQTGIKGIENSKHCSKRAGSIACKLASNVQYRKASIVADWNKKYKKHQVLKQACRQHCLQYGIKWSPESIAAIVQRALHASWHKLYRKKQAL